MVRWLAIAAALTMAAPAAAKASVTAAAVSTLDLHLDQTALSSADAASAAVGDAVSVPAVDEGYPGQRFRFKVTPYVWAAGISGAVQTGSQVPRPDVDLNIGDTFSNLDFFGFAGGEVVGDRFGAMGDFVYVAVSAGAGTTRLPPALALDGNLDLKIAVWSLAGFYRFHSGPRVDIDLIGGIRGYWVKTDLTVDGPFNTVFTGSADTSWVDGMVGARFRGQIGRRVAIQAQADVGAGGSKLSWEALGFLDYQFSDRWSGILGYRYLDVERTSHGRDIDVALSGPLIGAQFRF